MSAKSQLHDGHPYAYDGSLHHSESGQSAVLLVLILGMFLVPALGFSIDLTNIWFHRQSAQTAADAACQAGAMDLYASANGTASPNQAFTNFVAGTASDCSQMPATSLCQYAAYNGYSGGGFSSTAASNSVSWTFPTTVTGATLASRVTTSAVKVNISENVKTWFMALVGIPYQKVKISCTCGLVGSAAVSSLLVLDPTSSNSMVMSGNSDLTVIGGAQVSITVDSKDSRALNCNGGATINLRGAGPSGNGGSFDVVGGPTGNPGCVLLGTTGSYVSAAPLVPNPYATLPLPSQPATSITASTPEVVAHGYDGCPNSTGCYMYEPGYYSNGITVSSSSYAIFKPGLYYLDGNLTITGSSQGRPATPCVPLCSSFSTTTWQQTDGETFFFHTGQMDITSSANINSTVDPFPSTGLTCDGSTPSRSSGIPSSINGNVFIGQCAKNGTYWDSAGDTTDVRGTPGTRGIFDFQSLSDTTGPNFAGSSGITFVGAIYSHSTSPSNTKLVGTNGVTSYVLGQMVVDQLTVSGSGTLNLGVASSGTATGLKVSLLN